MDKKVYRSLEEADAGLKKIKAFIEWVEPLLKPQWRNDLYYREAWKEAIEKSACGLSFEIPARQSIDNRPHIYGGDVPF